MVEVTPSASNTPPQGFKPYTLANGRYRIDGILGQGGMARVVRAWDTRLEVYRAIKFLHDKGETRPRVQQRFENEARAMAGLHHPNVVTVHDIGEEAGRTFIVMEFLEGGSLGDQLRSGPMPIQRATKLMEAILDGLDAAHQEGIVHRDIKPQNILLTGKGVPKVADFGVAHLEDANTLTKTGSVLGTATYMAPEQKQGGAIDRRVDIFAAGATLLRMLTGVDPIDLHVPAVQQSFQRAVPGALWRVIQRATAYDREQRYPTARAMAEDLAWLGEGTEAESLIPLMPAQFGPGQSSPGQSNPRQPNPTIDNPSSNTFTFGTEATEETTRVGWIVGGAAIGVFGLGGVVLGVLGLGAWWLSQSDVAPPMQETVTVEPQAPVIEAIEPILEPQDETTVPPVIAPVLTTDKTPQLRAPRKAPAKAKPEVQPVAFPPQVPVFINTTPERANISIDGHPLGTTWWKGKLAPGEHVIVLEGVQGAGPATHTLTVSKTAKEVRFCWDFTLGGECPPL